ncbi:MAG: hypothetical protein OEL55_01570 [Desulfobulbaceae bacterium]|nr:hypothetical protein [Desulfobulbaceae bacterium]
MLEKDVPQDDGMAEGLESVCYAVDEKGDYVLVPSVGWDAKQVANDQAWDLINEEIENVRQQVLLGKKSILAYHMVKKLMDISLLAEYVGFSRLKVWLHTKPGFFARTSANVRQRYAQVLEISVEELTDLAQLESNTK